MSEILRLNPAVCAVGCNYQIMIVTATEALISVCVNGKMYHSHSNGVKLSDPGVHRITVPQTELDKACAYTVVTQKVNERLPYFPVVEPAQEVFYKFRPVHKTADVNIYHIADVHGELRQAVDSVNFVSENIDLLILNGDIANYFDTFEDSILCYKIISGVTKGEIPCVISRGNHDMRGTGAQKYSEYMPCDNGKTYYTFRAGSVWGMVLDAGEDKSDSHEAYSNTICCHDFRLEQENAIKKVIDNKCNEYDNDNVKYKLIISHIPFTLTSKEPFNIERPIYKSWTELIKNHIKPHLMLSGHKHEFDICMPGSEKDEQESSCPVIVGSCLTTIGDENFDLGGALIKLRENNAEVIFNTAEKIVENKAQIPIQ